MRTNHLAPLILTAGLLAGCTEVGTPRNNTADRSRVKSSQTTTPPEPRHAQGGGSHEVDESPDRREKEEALARQKDQEEAARKKAELLAAQKRAVEAQKADDAVLQANAWRLVAVHAGGKEVDFELLRPFNMRFVFGPGDALANQSTSQVQRGKYKIDSTKDPKEIDLVLDGKNGKFIYKFEKGELVVCGNVNLDQRPPTFDYKNEGYTIMRFQKKAP
jgi:uncharacterized protein (TIGR03067 family)